MKRAVWFAMLMGFLSSYAYSVERGKASGSMRVNDKIVERLEYSGARLQTSVLYDDETDIVLIASDKPVVVEDLADRTIAQDAGHVAVYFIKRKAGSYSVYMGDAEYHGSSDGVRFEGTLTDGWVVGRIYTPGVQKFDGGEQLEFDVQVNARIHSVIQKPFTSAENSAAAKSDQMKLYRAFLAAKNADSIQPTLSTGMAAKLEKLSGDVSLIRSGHKIGNITPTHVAVDGENAVLYLDAPGKKGTVRFVREGEVWKVNKEAWWRHW